nr:zinc finger, CCHC-type [Tanacetum cinerariifolium]
MDTIFDENRFSSVPRPSLKIPNRTEDIGGSVVLKEVTEEIFKRKLKVDGTTEKFKARLVIQSFRQKSGIDYFDTYALVARISTIRLLIALASTYNLIIHQMYMKTTFLNGKLDEEAPKQWHQNFDEVVLSIGYLLDQANKYVYSKFNEAGKRVIIYLYDMGEANVILVSTHKDTSDKVMSNNGQAESQLEYYKVIGCLMYAMTYIKPDSDFVMGKLILEGYTDASWLGNTKDNSSTSGWLFLLGGGAIYSASKKQTCITDSIKEYEFVALAAVVIVLSYQLRYAHKPSKSSTSYKKISAFVDSRLESIERFLNNFANQPNETNMNDLESDDESVDTPLVSPFPHSNNDLDDGEVLNEWIEYENVRMLCREKTINSFDRDDLLHLHHGFCGIGRHRKIYLDNKADVVMGKPFRKITKLEYDYAKGLMSFNRIFDNYTFQMPRTIPRFKHCGHISWSKIPPILELNQRDLTNGFKNAYEKNKFMYKNCLNLGPEYQVDESMKE